MSRPLTLAVGGVTTLALALGLTAGVLLAQSSPDPPRMPMAGQPVTHEQMHQMMDAMHGEGFSERMHQAMPGSEEMMDQCVAMMSMMRMPGMMGR